MIAEIAHACSPWRPLSEVLGAEDLDGAVGGVPDGACVRLREGDDVRLYAVVGGRALPLVLPDDARAYLGPEACASWDADPVAWWTSSRDGRNLLRVAGEAAARSGRGSPLHCSVVRAACDCARDALPTWEECYPSDARPRVAIETTERWCDGAATLDEVEAAGATAAWAATRAEEAAGAARAAWAAAGAAEAAGAATRAAWAAAAVEEQAASLARSAEHARRRIALPEVLAALVGGGR